MNILRSAPEYAQLLVDHHFGRPVPLSTVFDAARSHAKTPPAFWVAVVAELRRDAFLIEGE